MDDLVVLMDESHRYRAPASLKAINNLKPILGLEFTATPKFLGNVLYSFSLGEAVGRFVKSPRVRTRTNLTAADQQKIDDLRLKDGIYLHEQIKARLVEFCDANHLPKVKPFILVSTRDTTHAKEVRQYLESTDFHGGIYRGKAIEIHSKPASKEESDENVARLLEVESSSSSVEIVVHVTMLKEGWDVTNLYTIVPLRASVSEILTEQTIGRGLRLPFPLTESQAEQLNCEDPDILRLSIVSHDKYEEILAAKDLRADIFRDPVRDLSKEAPEPLKAVQVPTLFSDVTTTVLEGIARKGEAISTTELLQGDRREKLIDRILAQSQELAAARAATAEAAAHPAAAAQTGLFPSAEETAVPVDAEKVTRELRQRIENEIDALKYQIDVPEIHTYVEPKIGFAPFKPAPSGDFALVEQRMRSADLLSGQQETGDVLELEEIDKPVSYLAACLLDEVDELDGAEDKDRLLQMAGDYLEATGKKDEELRKLVHQYARVMAKDLASQVRNHLLDETEVRHNIRAGFIVFKPFSKSIRQVDGEVDLRVPPDEKSNIRRFLFGGITKSIINRTGFDSDTERRFAIALEDDSDVLKWVRPPLGQTPISYRGGDYNPDFIVETEKDRFLIEIKAQGELTIEEVMGKAKAAIEWCRIATENQRGKPWSYFLVPENSVSETNTLAFMKGQSIKF